MKLKIIEHPIYTVSFGDFTKCEDGKLTLNREALCRASLYGAKGKYKIDVDIANPGESKRILHITDIVKPACKEGGSAFPGLTGGIEGCGRGVTHQAKNLCVTQCFSAPGIQEGFIDMSGAGTRYSIFSSKINIVMTIESLSEENDKEILADDLVHINARAAEYVASFIKGDGGEAVEYDDEEPQERLPRIGYACFIQAQGPLRNVFVWGENCVKMKPRRLPATMVLDGAIVSGNYIVACQKNPTYLHQENPIILSALKKNGIELDFSGVIVSTESSSLNEKRDNAVMIADIAKEMKLDGIIISQEGGGHADVDSMLTCEACEEAGIKAVLIVNEIAGADGTMPSLVSFSPKADAIISTGNNDEVVSLPAVSSAVGGSSIYAKAATEEITTPLGLLYTATNQFGAGKMTTRQF